MFTIDLLKGEGIPIRCKPSGVAMVAFAAAVPAIGAILMLSCFLNDRIAISIGKKQITNYDNRIAELSEAVRHQELLQKEKKAIFSTLSEINASINRHCQWSPVLVTIVENVPASVVLTTLKVEQNFIKRKVVQKDDSKKNVTVDIPVRKLHMSLCGDPLQNCDQAIKNFRDQLRLSKLLAPRLEEITVSQRADMLDRRPVTRYEINCVFKEGS